ncbi:ABC transporter permease [Planctomycetes bacterium K23_9]|uniref:ABC-2 family transporter protein n=1 Tax=Stieleria marina TaxID=1930275 RepID=A0A517NSK1_9BACT|nr:hypothetical protein K239x_20300 [Planctomycetes bacterium K23_9]
MSNPISVFRSLCWKDAKAVMPLVIMAGAGIVVFNLLVFVGSLVAGSPLRADGYIMIWVLMPNLVALGAPALLVGGEEESGTLAWLRTLPVRWQNIVDAKFAVSAVAVIATWLAASLAIALLVASGVVRLRGDYLELTMVLGISKLLFFSGLLLAVSFACAYTFRSPITALLALVPSITIIYLFAMNLGEYLLSYQFRRDILGRLESYSEPASTAMWIFVTGLAISLLVALWVTQRWLGKRRLTRPAGAMSLPASISQSIQEPYRPPMIASRERPSPIRALHWQQLRQARWPLAGLTTMGVIALLMIRWEEATNSINALTPLAGLALLVAAVGLGALVFYGDNLNHRRAFFGDRGISPNQVWWTRILSPLAAMLVLTMLAVVLLYDERGSRYLWVFLPIAFACGQVVSMWASRPVLGLFGAPVFGMLCAVPLSLFFDAYQDYAWTAILLVPVLLFATWWICRRWLEGKVDTGFHVRMIAISIAAVLLPMVCVLGHRIATTPALNNNWRAKAMAATAGIGNSKSTTVYSFRHTSGYGFQWGQESGVFDLEQNYDSLADLQKKIRDDMDDLYSSSITNDDIAMIFDPNKAGWEMSPAEHAELRYMTVELVLQRIQHVREAAIQYEADLDDLQARAEIPELSVVALLSNQPELFGDDESVAELVDMISPVELRRESRIAALLSEWRRYQPDYRRAMKVPTGFFAPRTFAGILLSDSRMLGVEGRRSDRYLDEFVRVAWNQLDNGLPMSGTAEFKHRTELWKQAHAPYYGYWWRASTLQGWTKNHEMDLQELRKRHTQVTTAD